MFILNDLPLQVDTALLDLLVTAELAVISHFQHAGFMAPSICAHFQDRRVAGTAVTVHALYVSDSLGKARVKQQLDLALG